MSVPGARRGPAPTPVLDVASLAAAPNALAPDYGRFRVGERLLLTGHSHQAWPDVGFDAQRRAWLDAAEHVDRKWDAAFAQAARVRAGWQSLLEDASGHITLGPNTHELVVRLLSGLPLRERPRIVTTNGEFHTLRRQLDRLAEEEIDLVKVAADPSADLAERLAESVDDRTAIVAVSSVLFRTADIVPGLDRLLERCQQHGAELLVDAYHALGVVPFALPRLGLEGAWVVGGGYKYCQLGEGNCFLRAPSTTRLRPVITGWFAEFDDLTGAAPGSVAYPDGPGRFAGATYDPTAHYRGAAVFDFFARRGLTPTLLREVSQHQIGILARAFDELDLDPAIIRRRRHPLAATGGFLALRSPRAAEVCAALARREVWADHRDDLLRLGPAPYLCDDQLLEAVARLGRIVEELTT